VVPTRNLQLEGAVNFRDLGGYPTADGRRVAWRRLFRADGLGSLSESDRETLTGLGLTTVIDLRTAEEATHRGRFPIDEVPVRYHEFPLFDVLPTPEDLPSWNETAYIAERYGDMVAEGRPALAGAIDVLAEPGALPAVFHCSAGKDRTGVLSALLLGFLGVPDELIVEDYALSAAAMDSLFERLKADYPDAVETVERYAPAVLHVVPETMAAFLASLREDHDSYDSLASSLGVTEAVDRLRHALLVEDEGSEREDGGGESESTATGRPAPHSR
jgi:protein-tyrosine phosphatase